MVTLHERQQLVLLQEIDLVQEHEALRVRVLFFLVGDQFDDVLIALPEFLRGVDDERDDVRFRERGSDVIHHPHVEAMQRLVHARRVQKRDLPPRVVEHADDAIARGLRLVRHDRDLVPQHAIEQRRFAGVGTTD